MKKSEAKKAILTVIKVDPTLDERYLEKGYFQEKIDKANYILKTVGLPKVINGK